MDDESQPTTFREEVTTQEGVVKTIVANDPQELAEGVAAAKAEVPVVAPDINNPEDGNKIVSPDNQHTEPAFDQAVANNAPEEKISEEVEQPEEKPEAKPKKAAKTKS
jgi:hypothetical protein